MGARCTSNSFFSAEGSLGWAKKPGNKICARLGSWRSQLVSLAHCGELARRNRAQAGLSFRAGSHNRTRFVDVVVTALEFGFEADLEVGQIYQVPTGKIPVAVGLRRVLEADDQMDGVVAHLVGGDLRLEVERPETAVAAASGVKLRVEIEYAMSLGRGGTGCSARQGFERKTRAKSQGDRVET
jgi:hypothetical protein